MREIGPVVLAWTDARADRSARRRAAGDALLARLVAHLVPGVDMTIVRRCPVCGGTGHGRPVAPDAPVALSLSYAGSMVAAAAVRLEDAASVGVDIEPSSRDIGDLGPLFAPHDPPDIAGWTRIEAVLKADGRGIRIEPATVAIGDEPGRLPGSTRVVSPAGFEVVTVPGPEGFVVSVAVAATGLR